MVCHNRMSAFQEVGILGDECLLVVVTLHAAAYVLGQCSQDNNTEVSCKFFEKAEALTDPANLRATECEMRSHVHLSSQPLMCARGI